MPSHAKRITSKYDSSSRPPPPQKERPTKPLPFTPSIAPVSTADPRFRIAAWAANVEPGPPAPLSPQSRTPHSRHPSTSRREHRTISPVSTYINIPDAPRRAPPSSTVFQFDLAAGIGFTALGAAQLPPKAPGRSADLEPSKGESHGIFCRARSKGQALFRFRQHDPIPSKNGRDASPSNSKENARHPNLRRIRSRPVPLALAQQIEIDQFLGGGKIDRHARAYYARQGVDVWRDEHGVLWADEEEMGERADLLEDLDEWSTNFDERERWIEFAEESSVRKLSVISADCPDLPPVVTSHPEAASRKPEIEATSGATSV